jgi:hypothetical protein
MKVTYYYAVRFFCISPQNVGGGGEVIEGWCEVFVRVPCFGREICDVGKLYGN